HPAYKRAVLWGCRPGALTRRGGDRAKMRIAAPAPWDSASKLVALQTLRVAVRCEPTGGLSRRDKLAIAQCFSIGNALRRISRVPEGRLIRSQAHSTGAGLSRPSGTQILATGPPHPHP